MQSGGAVEMYSIGDLAAEFEVSPRAIRFYEDQGLIAPRRLGNNRVYTARDRARLKLILRGKRLGFALSDIKELLDLYDVDETQAAQLRATLGKARERIAELERQRNEITLTLQELRDVEKALVEMLRQKDPAAGAAARKERTS
jgi:DNA-binding transcriptional MerR regulator